MSYSKDAEWATLREMAAAAIPANYVKIGTLVASDAVEATTTATVLKATGHAASVGDQIVISSGTYADEGREVASITADTITLSVALSGAPTAADTFEIISPVKTSPNGGKLIFGNNRLDAPVYLSFDGTTNHAYIHNSATFELDLKAAGLHLTREGYIYIKYVSAPTSGSMYTSEIA